MANFVFLSKSAVFSVMAGGFLGTVARVLVFFVLPSMKGDVFANIIGSFCIGFFMFRPSVKNENENIPPEKFKINKRHFIGTGFLGSFTTFSSFMFNPFLSVLPENLLIPSDITPIFTWIFIIRFLIYVTAVSLLGLTAAAAGKYAAERGFKRKAAPRGKGIDKSGTDDEFIKFEDGVRSKRVV